jgi:hypothetical protein
VYGESKWGICFDTFALNRLSFEVATSARQIDSSITNTEARRVIYAAVLRHELEHAIQELVIAEAVVAGVIGVTELWNQEFSNTGSYRETIASHFEHLDVLKNVTKVPPRKQNVIRRVLQRLPAPMVYRDWEFVAVDQLDEKFEKQLRLQTNTESVSSQVRTRVNGNYRSRYLEVPLYSWLGNGLALEISGLDLRAMSLDCKKVLRFLKKDGLAVELELGLFAEKSSDHDLKLLGAGRPIKFACHDWDQVPEKVLSEIASAAQISKSELVEKLRKHL